MSKSHLDATRCKIGKTSSIRLISKTQLSKHPAIRCHLSKIVRYTTLTDSQLQVALNHLFSKLFQKFLQSSNASKLYLEQTQSHIKGFENINALLDVSRPTTSASNRSNYQSIGSNQHRQAQTSSTLLKIIINFGWGHLTCASGVIDFAFTTNEQMIIQSSMPVALKNIPNEYITSTSSLITATLFPDIMDNNNNNQKNNRNTKENENKRPEPRSWAPSSQSLVRSLEKFETSKHIFQLPIANNVNNPLVYASSPSHEVDYSA